MLTNFADAVNIREPHRMSFSSLSTYAECGEKWKLERMYGISTTTWYATVAGSAIHTITERYDRGEWTAEQAVALFQYTFDRLIAKEQEKGVYIKASGKKLVKIGDTGGPDKKDYTWWLEYGPQYVQAWIDWRADNPHLVLLTMPDGTPAIEVEVDAPLGGEPNKGFIDRVFRDVASGEIIVVDLKTGNDPAGNLQLGQYGVSLRRQYGIEATSGAYWSAQKGGLNPPVDLSIFSDSYVDYLYEAAWAGIRAGVFLPNTSGNCRTCDGAPFCRAIGGRAAQVYPVRVSVQS